MPILNFNMSLALGDTLELEFQNCVIYIFISSVSFLSKCGSLPPKAHVSFWRGSSILSCVVSALLRIVQFRFKSIQVCLIYLPFLKWWLSKEVVITLRATLLSYSLLFFPMLVRTLKRFFTIMIFLSIFSLTQIFNLESIGFIFCIFSKCIQSWYCSTTILLLKNILYSLEAHNQMILSDFFPSHQWIASYQNVEVSHQKPMFHFEEDHQFSLIY